MPTGRTATSVLEKGGVLVIIPTFNSLRTLAACLSSVRAQRPGGDKVPLFVADGGSTDGTLTLARDTFSARIVPNPLQTGEAGKSAGIAAAQSEIIALVDSDNILDSPDWLNRMLAPFSDPDIVASEPLSYTWRAEDPPLTRYFALLGMNDPLCLFAGNYDRMSMVTGRWTDLPVDAEDKGDYLKVTLSEDALPTIGANGFVFRRSLLDHVNWTPYFFDIDIMHQAVRAGFRHVAKVKCGIVHLYCRSLSDFARKQRRRVRDFLYFSSSRQRTYPWQNTQRRGVARFILSTVLVLPLVWQMIRGFCRKPDIAWLYHIPVCWITLWIYGTAVLLKIIGFKPAMLDRAKWRQ